MNYYDRHLGDYTRDCSHLSLLEHGVYIRLIDVYLGTEKAIPVANAARLIGAKSREEKVAVTQILEEFFYLDGDVWRQKRCEEILETHRAGEPDREAKRSNEALRQERHRERRRAIFESLRLVGVIPDWNTGMPALQALLDQHCNGQITLPVTLPVTSAETSRVTLPVTPATATHSPSPIPHSPSPTIEDRNPEAINRPRGREKSPTPAQVEAARAADQLPADVQKAISGTVTALKGTG